jgi:hypothetical protein
VLTDKELIRVLNKEIAAGRKWMQLAYKHRDDDSILEPAWKAWQKAMEATDNAKERVN